MPYTPTIAISEFDALLLRYYPAIAQSAGFPALKAPWPNYLTFLQPVINESMILSDEERLVGQEFQVNQTTVVDPFATERAYCFGTLTFAMLINNETRRNYGKIHLAEVALLWRRQSGTPMDSLRMYGTMVSSAIPKFEAIGKCYLAAFVEPNVTVKRKMGSALDWFGSLFICGVLLGQIDDYMTLKDHMNSGTGGV